MRSAFLALRHIPALVTERLAELLDDFSMLAGTFRRIISPCIGDKDLRRGLGRKILWSVCDFQ
jgi:hypothetical protein